MIVCKDLSEFTAGGSFVITLGNFDGVHLGHQEILRTVSQIASKYHLQKGIFTFHPHPLRFFGSDLKLITTRRKKHQLFAEQNMDYLFELPFDRSFADIDPEVFVREFLVKRLHARVIVVGYDYHFGKGRAGNYDLLTVLGAKYGFTAIRVPKQDLDGVTVSSSLIRTTLAQGDVGYAGRLLGRPFTLEGIVVRGDGIGRTIGCPTANIHCENELLPADGVYATRTTVRGKVYDSSTYVGYRPTIQGEKELRVETHLLDFNEDIYEDEIEIAFVDRVRGDMKFNSLDELVARIHIDLDLTRTLLRAQP